MKIVKPSYEIVTDIDGLAMLKRIEAAGRTCYKSESKITDDSCREFIAKILKSGHHSVIEHESVSVRIVCDRGITHEIVRHRLASYSQESTRYCNYSKGKYGGEITVIKPYFWQEDCVGYRLWLEAMQHAERLYLELVDKGASAQEARSVLPNSLKTEIVMTCNVREWRHFFKLRAAPAAHPQMREIAMPMLAEFKSLIPVIFDDIVVAT